MISRKIQVWNSTQLEPRTQIYYPAVGVLACPNTYLFFNYSNFLASEKVFAYPYNRTCNDTHMGIAVFMWPNVSKCSIRGFYDKPWDLLRSVADWKEFPAHSKRSNMIKFNHKDSIIHRLVDREVDGGPSESFWSMVYRMQEFVYYLVCPHGNTTAKLNLEKWIVDWYVNFVHGWTWTCGF